MVFGVMADKALLPMLTALSPWARPLILTQAPGRRAADPDALAEIARARRRSAGGHRRARCEPGAGARVAAWQRGGRGGIALSGRRRARAHRTRARVRCDRALPVPEAAWYRGRKLRVPRLPALPACFDSSTMRSAVPLLLDSDAGHAGRGDGAHGVCAADGQLQGDQAVDSSSRSSKDHIKLTGQVEIDCGNESMSADQVEIFTRHQRDDRHGQRRVHERRQPHRGRPARIQHAHAHGHVLQRLRHVDAAESRSRAADADRAVHAVGQYGQQQRPATSRCSGPRSRRLLLRREDLEGRRRRSTASPTAASRRACSRRRGGSSRRAR